MPDCDRNYFYHPLLSSSSAKAPAAPFSVPNSTVPHSWRPRSKFKLFTTLWPHLFGDHYPEPLSSDEYNYLAWPRCCHSGMFGPKTQNILRTRPREGRGLLETAGLSPPGCSVVHQGPFFMALHMCCSVCYPDIFKRSMSSKYSSLLKKEGNSDLLQHGWTLKTYC